MKMRLDCRLPQLSLAHVVHVAESVSVDSTIACIHCAKLAVRTWDTQSLPMMVNDRINLVTFETGVLGEIWQESLCE